MTTDASPQTDEERPLRRDAARNRERILQAAGEVFATRGLEVTLDDIAHCAGVGVGTVYRRFHDKEELIDALFDDRMDALLTVAEEALAADDPWLGLEPGLGARDALASVPARECELAQSAVGRLELEDADEEPLSLIHI